MDRPIVNMEGDPQPDPVGRISSLDRRLSRVARRHEPGLAWQTLAQLGSPSLVTAEGIAAALALPRRKWGAVQVAVAPPVALLACLWREALRTRGWRVALTLGAAVGILVCTERIGVGAHWPSDVAAGAGLGALVGLALGQIARRPSP